MSKKRFQSHSTFLSVSSFATTPLPWTRLWCLYILRGLAFNSFKRFAHTFHWQKYFLEMLHSSSLLVCFLAYPLLAVLIFIFNIIENPISADIQIRFINFVALESGFIFLAKHKFKNFVLTVCEINSYWFSTWDWLHHGRVRRKLGAPKLWAQSEEEKIHTQVAHRVKWTIYLFYRPISRTYFPVGHFWLVNTVMRSIRTPGTNRGLDIQNFNFHVREVPFEVALTLWRIPITPWYFGVIVLKLSNLFFFFFLAPKRASQNHESLHPQAYSTFDIITAIFFHGYMDSLFEMLEASSTQ